MPLIANPEESVSRIKGRLRWGVRSTGSEVIASLSSSNAAWWAGVQEKAVSLRRRSWRGRAVWEKCQMNFRQKFLVLRKDWTSRSLRETGQSVIALILDRLMNNWPWQIMCPRYLTIVFSNWHLTGLAESPLSCMIWRTLRVQWSISSWVLPRMIMSSM